MFKLWIGNTIKYSVKTLQEDFTVKQRIAVFLLRPGKVTEKFEEKKTWFELLTFDFIFKYLQPIFIKENKTRLIKSMNSSIDISKRLLLVITWQMAAFHTVAIIVVYSGNSPDTNPELLQMYSVRVNGERGRWRGSMDCSQ